MSQDKIQKARELVLNYIATHTLSDKLNRAVNEVCRSRPKDPWLFLSDIVSEWTKDVPIVDRLVAKQGIDCYGNSSIQLQLFGRVSNARPPRYLGVENVFIMNSSNNPCNNNEEKKQDNDSKTSMDECVKSMMKKVSEYLSPALRSIRIDEQTKIDDELYKLYSEGLQEESIKYKQFNIIPTISSLIAITTSNYLRMPLYKYLHKTKTNTFKNIDDDYDNINYILPNIMCELIKSELNILPSINIITHNNKMRALDKIIMITDITNELINIIKTNNKNKNVCFDTNTGAIVLENNICNNIEQLMDLIYKSVENCNGKYEINKDILFSLSFTNNPKCILYNSENKEYILNGENKTTDDIIEYFNIIINKYKGIKYLEDPLSDIDIETYALINDKQIQNGNENVIIIGNGLYNSLYEEIRKGISNGCSSGIMLTTQEIFTLTKALNISNMIKECNGNKAEENRVQLMLSDNYSDNSNNTYGIDLGIACNVDIIRLSLPNCGKSYNKYNRWLMIADELNIEIDNQEINGGNVNDGHGGNNGDMDTIDEQSKDNQMDENIGTDADKADLP